jgi:excisionase family DNA binding protein
MTNNLAYNIHNQTTQELRIVDKPEYGEWVTVTEAGEIMGVHRETVRLMIKRGDLPAEMIIVNGRAQWRIKYVDAINADVNPPHRPPKTGNNQTIL